MSFFDKLGKTVTNTAHSVVEKTKSSTETIRLNGLINDEEKNINAAYLNMGRKYAELHTADAEPEFQEFLSAIAASQEKIAEYREQIRKTKHLLICQGCGAEIPETVLYCTKCGAENPVGKQLAEERAAREAAERAQREAEAAARQAASQAPQAPAGAECCPNCGKPRMAGAMFCTFCGNPFVAAAPTPAPAPAPAPAEQPIPPAGSGRSGSRISRTGSCSRRSTGGTARRTGSGHGSGNSGSCSGGCTGRSAGTALPQLRQSGSGGESFLYPLRSRNDRPAGSRRACTGNAPAGCTGTHLPQLRKARS